MNAANRASHTERNESQFSPRRRLALRAIPADESSARTIVVERREVNRHPGTLLNGPIKRQRVEEPTNP
jgi:hypothetical protein